MTPDFIELIRKRRSIRRFTDTPVSPEQIDLLKETALRAPTSRNFRPWEFVFVTDRDLLLKLSECKPHGAAFLAQAPLGIVVYADETKSDVWIEDCSIASIMLQLSAQALGLGSCWIQVRNRQHTDSESSEEYIRDLLDLPDNVRILSVLAIGHPAENPESLPADPGLNPKINCI